MTGKRKDVSRSTTDRLSRIIETELARQGITGEEAAREARLPSNAFRSLLGKGHRPTVDRADELCRALGVSMTIGIDAAATDTRTGTEQGTADASRAPTRSRP